MKRPKFFFIYLYLSPLCSHYLTLGLAYVRQGDNGGHTLIPRPKVVANDLENPENKSFKENQ